MSSKQEKMLCLGLGIGQKPGSVTLGTLCNLTELPGCRHDSDVISATLIYSFPLIGKSSQGLGMLGWD